MHFLQVKTFFYITKITLLYLEKINNDSLMSSTIQITYKSSSLHNFLKIILLFNYTCLHFIPPLLPHPSQTHLPPQLPPSPLVLSMCPL